VTLRERLKSEITTAMRSGDSLRRDTLRMAENAIYNAEKRDRRTYADDEVAAVIGREVKTRRESVEAFRAGHREDLATKEEAEIGILSAFLPAQIGDAELAALVGEALAATGASSPREIGKAMSWLVPRTRGRADGRRVSEAVARRLAAGPGESGTPGGG
jgi:uncharacterized protein YqeY